MILGLDVSTSNIGISLFSMDGELLKLTHISLDDDKTPTSLQRYLYKAKLFESFITKNFQMFDIQKIIIEEPLGGSVTPSIAVILSLFNEEIQHKCSVVFPKSEIIMFSVDNSRRYGLPELLGGKKQSLFGSVPKEIEGVKINEFRKLLVMHLIGQKYPDIVWLLNNNYNLDKRNFDRADSVCVVLGYMFKEKIWNNPPANVDIALEFVTKYINYEKFMKDNKTSSRKESSILSINYLTDVFKMSDYINCAV